MSILDPKPPTRAELTATYAQQWKPATAYAAGQPVVNPSGDVVTAKAAFTSGATYDAANWNTAPGIAAKLDKTEAAASYAPKASPAFTGVPTVNGQQIAPAATPYPYWRKKVAQVRAGLSDAKLLCLGDSTTFGYVAPPNDVATPPIASYPSDLAAILNNYFAPAFVGLGIPKAQSGSSKDGRWTVGSGWTYTPGSAIGWGNSEMYFGTASSGGLVYTPGTSAGTVDTFDVYYVHSSSAPFTIQATGGAPVTVTPTGSAGVYKATCTAGSAATTNSVTITTGTGTERITGVEAYHSSIRRIRVGNAGVGGSTSKTWGAASNSFNSIPHITAYAPDLTIIDLGINDFASPNTPAATFKANITAIVNAAKLSGDVILMVPPPPDISGNLAAGYAELIPTYPDLATTLQTGLVDITSRWVSRNNLNPLGYYSDTLHPSRIGYGDMAQAVSTLIRAI